ncbi:hypothetical protein TIFTF001_038982 [Ficus carica]|uniref:Uncharacterized protein n=1 Tax=Ficus carica TaxID=3494 RepID=A0AA88JDH1_FICCA|nr:hypothetical protein TIFTF001_038982 [Ficus carica]
MCPTIQVMGGHECRSLVLVQAASTVSIRSGGRWWCRSRDKNKYNDRYRMSGVRWCRVVGVACLATVQLSEGMGRLDKGSMGRPSWKGLSSGRGSIIQVSNLKPNGDLLGVLKGEAIRGSGSSTEVLVGQPGDPRRDFIYSRDLTSLVWSGFSRVVGSFPLSGKRSLLVLACLVL